MNEAKLNVRIKSTEKFSVEAQIALVQIVKERLNEILPEGTQVFVTREVSNEELLNSLT